MNHEASISSFTKKKKIQIVCHIFSQILTECSVVARTVCLPGVIR